MTPDKAISVLRERSQRLSVNNGELESLSEKKAATKRDYAEAFAKKITELKINGEKATIVKELANGDKAIAKLRYEKDVADGVYEAKKSVIKGIIEDLGVYRSILSYEKNEIHEKH